MRKGSAVVTVLIVAVVAAVIYFVVFPNFQLPTKKPVEEVKYKNDVVTIENYFVGDKAPYSGRPTTIEFELHNNGDRKIPYLELDFFDTPGFNVTGLDCQTFGEDKNKYESENISKCVFIDFESLDARSIKLTLNASEISSPTPYSVSFAIKYVYFGFREANIPIIDGLTKKQPTTKFRQSEPSVGPIVLDIEPLLERTVVVDSQTVKQYWGIGGGEDRALPFTTKFKFKHVGSVQGKIKDVNITTSSVRITLFGLKTEGLCDFCNKSVPDCQIKIATLISPEMDFLKVYKGTYYVDIGGKYFGPPVKDIHNYLSEKSILVPFDTLLCTFEPTEDQPEYTATISAVFAYKYEFIRTQEFVVQPLPE